MGEQNPGAASAAPVVFRKLRRDRAIMYAFQIMDSLGNLGRAQLEGDLLPRACNVPARLNNGERQSS